MFGIITTTITQEYKERVFLMHDSEKYQQGYSYPYEFIDEWYYSHES